MKKSKNIVLIFTLLTVGSIMQAPVDGIEGFNREDLSGVGERDNFIDTSELTDEQHDQVARKYNESISYLDESRQKIVQKQAKDLRDQYLRENKAARLAEVQSDGGSLSLGGDAFTAEAREQLIRRLIADKIQRNRLLTETESGKANRALNERITNIVQDILKNPNLTTREAIRRVAEQKVGEDPQLNALIDQLTRQQASSSATGDSGIKLSKRALKTTIVVLVVGVVATIVLMETVGKN